MSEVNAGNARRVPRSELARVAVVAIAYFVAARVCIEVAEQGSDLAPVWIPSGIAVAAVLRWGPTMAIGVVLGEFLAVIGEASIGVAGGLAIGNGLEALIAVAVLHRMRVAPVLTHVKDVFAIVVAAALGACVSTVIGVTSLALGGMIPWDEVPRQMLLFWWSVVLGIVIVTPFVIAWRPRDFELPSVGRVFEASMLTISVVVVGGMALTLRPLGGALLVLFAPLLLWACLRFRTRGATGVIALLSIMSAVAVYEGDVTLGLLSTTDSAQVLQGTFALLAVSALFLVALIAERDQAIQRAIDANDRLVLAQRVAGCGSWELDLHADDAPQLAWSTELCRLLELEPGTPPSVQNLVDRVHEDDRQRLRTAIRAAMHEGAPFSLEHRVVVPSGKELVMLHTATVSLDSDRRPDLIVAVALDITGQKSLDRLRDALVATASHELRTPLTSIIGLAGTLVERWDQLHDAQRREFANIIEQQGLHLSTIIDDTLMQSRLDAHGVQVPNDRVDLRRVIADAVGVLGDAGGHIEVTCARDLFVAGSAEHVRRIITNLLTNASKYGDAPITIEVLASDVPSMVDIHVVDHGPGIPNEFQPIMYHRFARGLGTSSQPGTGLGLSIVRGLVEAAGGSVTYRRRDDEHATDFTVQLPMWPRPLGEASHDHRAAAAASLPPHE